MKRLSNFSFSIYFFLLFSICFLLQTCASSTTEEINLGLSSSNFSLKSMQFPVEVQAVKLDSINVRIDNAEEYMFMGSITDDIYGQVKAQHYTEISPESLSTKIPSGATYTSARLVLVGQYINAKDEAVDLNRNQSFSLYEVTESIPTANHYNEKLKVLKPNDGLSSNPIDTFSFNASNSKKTVTVSGNDIDYYQKEVTLPNSFGQKLFDLRKTENTDFATTLTNFKTQIKGLAFIPNANNSLIVGFFYQTIATDFGETLEDERSFIEISYSIVENGTTVSKNYKFYFNDVGGTNYRYTQYIVDRTNSRFANVQNTYTAYNNDWVGLSSKTGLSMKISLDPMREFVKNNPNARISRAHIKLDNVIESTPINNIVSFIAGFTAEDNKRIWKSGVQKAIKQVTTTATEFKYVYSDTSRNLLFSRSTDKDYYFIDISVLTEVYLNNVREDEEDLILYPINNTQPNRFYLNKSDVVFEVFYTEIQ